MATLAVAILFLPLASAADGQSRAELSISVAKFAVEGVWTTTNVTVGQIDGGTNGLELKLRAQSLTVNWTRASSYEFSRVQDPNDVFFQIKINRTSGEKTLGQSEANSSSVDPRARMLSSANGSTELTIDSVTTVLRAAPDAPLGMTGDVPTAPEVLQIEPGQATLSAEKGHASMTGNFSFLLWAANITISSHGEHHFFRSGNWSESILWVPGAAPGVARIRHHQLLRIDVTNGLLEVKGERQSWSAFDLQFQGHGVARLELPKGRLLDGSQSALMQGSLLEIAGSMRVKASNRSADPVRPLVMTIESDPQSFKLARPGIATRRERGLQTAFADVATRPLLPLIGVGSLAVLAIPFLAGAKSKLKIDDVEFALLTGDAREARRMAARLIRGKKPNLDAAFLFGAACLVRREYALLLKTVEPTALRVPRRDRRGLAFLLTLAAREEGDGARERRWSSEASQDPRFAAHLASGEVAGVPGRRSHDETAMNSYA